MQRPPEEPQNQASRVRPGGGIGGAGVRGTTPPPCIPGAVERQEPRLPQDLAAAQRCPAGPPPTRSGAAAQRTHRRPPCCPPERQEPRLPLDLAVVQCPCCPWNAQTPGWWHCCARPCTLHSKSNLSTSPCFLHYSPTCQPPLPSPWDGGGYVFPMLRVPALTPGFGNESNTQLG